MNQYESLPKFGPVFSRYIRIFLGAGFVNQKELKDRTIRILQLAKCTTLFPDWRAFNEKKG